MGKDKSILEKITDKIKDIADIATDAANQAKAERPAVKGADRSFAYIPLAADGLVTDPMMVPPLAAAPARKTKRVAPKRTARRTGKKPTRKAVSKSAGRSAKRSAAKRSRTVIKRSTRKTTKKTAKGARKALGA
jgi:hypothetical protein